jgi:uncharacterized membrane-anchored protein
MAVEPKAIMEGDPVTVTYSITNNTSNKIERANMSVLLMIGRNTMYDASVQLADISQDIGPGETVKGTVTSSMTFVNYQYGDNKVFITMGRKLADDSIIEMVQLAETPLRVDEYRDDYPMPGTGSPI